ncbi:MAG: HAD family phosphatase [bacterium]|nr:HAD family phosphatase [bacterium]
MIRAVFFDFNGVIVDDEPVHFELFQKVLEEEGLKLSKKGYYEKYLGMDDHDCFTTAIRDQGKSLTEDKIEGLIERKAGYYQKKMAQQPPFVPGALEIVKDLGQTHYLAVVSGALRSEIEFLLKLGGIQEQFSVVVAAGEVAHGKPKPDGYQKAMALLNRDFVASSERLLPEECLAIEDSHWGIESAQAAGMVSLGVTTTYEEKELPGALYCLKDFSKLSGEELLKRAEASR